MTSDPKTLEDLRSAAKAVKFMSMYAAFMDTYGGDVLIGLIPGAGDGASTIASLLIGMQQAHQAKLPVTEQLKILLNQAIDFGIGTVPIVGDIADFFYKSNVHARERFAKHFRTQLLSAWSDNRIAASDVAELTKLSGIAIRLPK